MTDANDLPGADDVKATADAAFAAGVSTPPVTPVMPPSPPPVTPQGTPAAGSGPRPAAARPTTARRWTVIAGTVLLLLTLFALALSWLAQRRVQDLERELVRRQQSSETDATEARLLAKEAQSSMRDATAKVALLDARLAELTQQRGQLDELVESLSRSRDDNLAADVESALRTSVQQAGITGSTEPALTALKLADERLARANQPRFDGVRRAVAHDLDRLRTVPYADLPALSSKLDDAVRIVDDAPLLAVSAPLRIGAAVATPAPAGAGSAAAGGWSAAWARGGAAAAASVWAEIRSLVRVSRIDRPESVLIAPDERWFLRENLKLRLLDARLALQSRRFDTVQVDLAAAAQALDRYFDPSSKRTLLARRLVAEVADDARQVDMPRPDDTFAALAALAPR